MNLRNTNWRFMASSLASAIILVFTPPAANAQVSPLAHYRFNNDATDATTHQNPMQIAGGTFIEGTLSLPADDYAALAKINGFNYDAFTVGFDLKPNTFADPYLTLLSCGPNYRWLGLENDEAGHLILTLNNTRVRYQFENVITVGRWHTVVCVVDSRARQTILYLDGEQLPTVPMSGSPFDVVGTDAEEADKIFSFWNFGNATRFNGQIDNLRIFSGAMTAAEVSAIFAPKLNITHSGQDALVWWSADLTGYILETTPATAPGAIWKPHPQTPATIADQKLIADTQIDIERFYRLSRKSKGAQ